MNKIILIFTLLFFAFSISKAQEQDDHLRRLSKEAQKDRVRTPQGWYHDPIPHSRLRNILSKINLEVTSGLGKTYYAHRPLGYAVYSGANGVRLFDPAAYNSGTGTISSSFSQWFHTSQTTGSFGTTESDYLVLTDTTKLKFRNKTTTIPFNAAIYFKIARFRLGGGFDYELQFISKFSPTKLEDDIMQWKPDIGFAGVRKFYGMLGAEVYRYQDFIFSADARIGGWKPSKKFDRALMDRSLFFNFGMGIEWARSEYFRPYVRPNFEFKNYVLTIPENSGTIKHNANQFTVNVGVVLQIPALPKCFIKNCLIQMNHQHGDREYRSRAHPIWKKQNPQYGENYPRLFKYKRKNRNKINPY